MLFVSVDLDEYNKGLLNFIRRSEFRFAMVLIATMNTMNHDNFSIMADKAAFMSVGSQRIGSDAECPILSLQLSV